MSGRQPEQGYFVIADISGYTKFLAETEIAHAKAILEELFKVMLPVIRAPLSVAGFQGDAVFAYAVDNDIVQNQFILDAVEKIYCVFADTRERIRINTSCPCKACAGIEGLDLKIVVHHGEYIRQSTGGRDEIAGKDVITAFRLLKNRVTEETGLDAYALITCDAVRQMGIGDFFDADAFHREVYDHIGEIEYVVHPLKDAWLRHKDAQLVYVSADDDQLVQETTALVPLSPSAAFTLCTRPDLRQQWIGSDKIDLAQSGKGGKIEVDSVYHCHHGDQIIVFEIVDWRPGEYATGRYVLPMGMYFYETMELVPVGEGTLIKFRHSRIKSTRFAGRIMSRFMEPKMRKQLSMVMPMCADNLAQQGTAMVEDAPSLALDQAPGPERAGLSRVLDERFAA